MGTDAGASFQSHVDWTPPVTRPQKPFHKGQTHEPSSASHHNLHSRLLHLKRHVCANETCAAATFAKTHAQCHRDCFHFRRRSLDRGTRGRRRPPPHHRTGRRDQRVLLA